MMNKFLNCLKRLLSRNSNKPKPPKCPDFIPDREEMTWVDPEGFEELHERAVNAFDLAIELYPFALQNCKTIYENCYNKPAANKEFNDWNQPEWDNPLY
tara:strand:+ start:2361 stop:2657 length:297 start_codon:yes stop_codon:yes gene_type:complete